MWVANIFKMRFQVEMKTTDPTECFLSGISECIVKEEAIRHSLIQNVEKQPLL